MKMPSIGILSVAKKHWTLITNCPSYKGQQQSSQLSVQFLLTIHS